MIKAEVNLLITDCLASSMTDSLCSVFHHCSFGAFPIEMQDICLLQRCCSFIQCNEHFRLVRCRTNLFVVSYLFWFESYIDTHHLISTFGISSIEGFDEFRHDFCHHWVQPRFRLRWPSFPFLVWRMLLHSQERIDAILQDDHAVFCSDPNDKSISLKFFFRFRGKCCKVSSKKMEETNVSDETWKTQRSTFHFQDSYTPPSIASTGGKYGEKPPLPRNETKLCGLQNQGATWWRWIPFDLFIILIVLVLV